MRGDDNNKRNVKYNAGMVAVMTGQLAANDWDELAGTHARRSRDDHEMITSKSLTA